MDSGLRFVQSFKPTEFKAFQRKVLDNGVALTPSQCREAHRHFKRPLDEIRALRMQVLDRTYEQTARAAAQGQADRKAREQSGSFLGHKTSSNAGVQSQFFALKSDSTAVGTSSVQSAVQRLNDAKRAMLQIIDKTCKLWEAGDVSEAELVNKHPVTADNKIDLIIDGTNAFPQIYQAIDDAEKSINLSYFIFHDDEIGRAFADKLLAKVAQGVEVNFTIDASGERLGGAADRKLIAKLRAGGVNIIRNKMIDLFNPAEKLNHPDHRKVVIIDGKTAFTGGMNVGKEYYDGWHDVMVRVQGSNVQQLQAEWLTNWMHLGGKLHASIDSGKALKQRYFPELTEAAGSIKAKVVQMIPGEHREIHQTFLQMIRQAKHTVQVEVPYFTDREIQQALMEAARPPRNVKVELLIPADNNHKLVDLAARSRFGELRNAGVDIYEIPGMTHGKIMRADDQVCVGSSNMDGLAFNHIYEMNLLIDDKAYAEQVGKELFEVDIQRSRKITILDLQHPGQLFGAFFNMFRNVL